MKKGSLGWEVVLNEVGRFILCSFLVEKQKVLFRFCEMREEKSTFLY